MIKKKSYKTPLLILLLGAVLATGVKVFMAGGNDGAEAVGENMRFVPVTLGSIEESVTAQGKLEPKEYVDVGAQVSGQLEKIHVEIGDVVKTGDLLAEIDPKIYEARAQANEARVKTLQAQLNEQQAQVELATQQYERAQALIETKAISQVTYDNAMTARKVAQAKMAAIRAQLEEARSTLNGDKTNLSYTKIYAPMDGTVVLQVPREGQTLNASQTAPVLMQIANLDTMTVRAQVAEADVMRVRLGMPVYFTTLGSLERKWKGEVRQILPAPEVINDVVLFNVLVDVDNRDRQLMTGMSTQVFFVLGKAENVPLVPTEALGKRLEGGAYQIKVKSGGGAEERTVSIGLMNRTNAEVKSGLEVGDEVAVPVREERKSWQGGPPGAGKPKL